MNRAPRPSDREFDLSGGVLCLDFANTVDGRKNPSKSDDFLPAYRDLVRFAKQSRVLPTQSARNLVAAGLRNPQKANAVLRGAVMLREAIYRIFSNVAAARIADSHDVALVKKFVDEAWKHRELIAAGRSFRWEWRQTKDADALAYMLWPIAQSAADLMTSDKRNSVRQCGADDCAWLFLDESRNHSRRWCDMKTCGNRQKARRHYALKHG